MNSKFRSTLLSVVSLVLVCTTTLAGCTPKYDWRDVKGSVVPFTVLMPGKPTIMEKAVGLDGIKAQMSMTAVEIDNVAFAVGSAELANNAQARAALTVMKDTMVKNIDGTIVKDDAQFGDTASSIDLVATGVTSAGVKRLLRAHFVANNKRVYQAVVVGPEKAMPPEAVETFLNSFKPR